MDVLACGIHASSYIGVKSFWFRMFLVLAWSLILEGI